MSRGAKAGLVGAGILGVGALGYGLKKLRDREKNAEADDQITKDKVKRLLQYGGAGAAGMGLGYATGKLVGRPIQKKLVRWGAGPKGAKLVRYGVPTSAGLGAALMVSKKLMDEKLTKKIRGDDNA